jgi:hypothetical protein
VREPAPPYAGEGPHALWHVSDNASIDRFEPRRSADGPELVWAVDTRHLPLYWFPRECPRGTFWADSRTTAADRDAFLGAAARVHAIQRDWLAAMEAARLALYRLPEETFRPHPDVGGYWISSEAQAPVELIELSNLCKAHDEAQIALRVVDDLWLLWERVIASSLEFSGIRLRNLRTAPARA